MRVPLVPLPLLALGAMVGPATRPSGPRFAQLTCARRASALVASRRCQVVRMRDDASGAIAALRSRLVAAPDECNVETARWDPEGSIVLLRHGESEWNAADRFTGWQDVGLSARGERQALSASAMLRDLHVSPDVTYTSTLKRTIKTAWIVHEQLDCYATPIVHSYRLNERMYGALTGLHKVRATHTPRQGHTARCRRRAHMPRSTHTPPITRRRPTTRSATTCTSSYAASPPLSTRDRATTRAPPPRRAACPSAASRSKSRSTTC